MTVRYRPTRRRRIVRALLLALAVVVWSSPAGAVSGAAQDVDERTVEREVTAEGAVLWDPIERRVLWGRDARSPRRMASTTKIMTAWLAIEAGTLDDTVTVSGTAAAADTRPGAATLGLHAGERITMRDLLTGLMLRSGNDGAVAVAEHVAGSEAAFVERMNAAVRELGMNNTSFINASGLTNSTRHHASPLDLAVLAHHAMADDEFAEIAGTVRADVSGLGSLQTRNLLLGRYEGATGVKTGYMASAGLCLVASATRDGRDLYAVVLDSDDSFGDAAVLLDLGYDAFVVVAVDDAVPAVYRTASGVVNLARPGGTDHTIAVGSDVRVRTSLSPVPPDDITTGTVLGRAELVVDGEVRSRSPLRAVSALPTAPEAPPATVAGAVLQDAIRAFVRATPQRRPVPEVADRIVRQAARS